jgi:hypothetical protein
MASRVNRVAATAWLIAVIIARLGRMVKIRRTPNSIVSVISRLELRWKPYVVNASEAPRCRIKRKEDFGQNHVVAGEGYLCLGKPGIGESAGAVDSFDF